MPPDDDEAALRAEIERDFLANGEMLWDLASRPTRKGLDKRLATVMVEGSPAFREVRANVIELVELDQRIMLDDPPVRETVVERVELVGHPPYREARVTYCSVDNANRVEDLPGGEVGYIGTPRNVRAVRYERPMRKTPAGWKEYAMVEGYIARWEGERCRDS